MSTIWKSENRAIDIFVESKHEHKCAIIIELNDRDTGLDVTSWVSKEEALSMAKAIIKHYKELESKEE